MKNPQATAAPAKRKTTGGLERVVLRNEFYRDKFRLMAAAMPVILVALVISIGLNVALATRKPQERYFSVDPAGRITKIVALTEPYVSDAYLGSWASEKVSRAYSMDAQNYRRQVGDLKQFFTPEGHEQYIQSLVSSGNIELMVKNLLIVSAVPTGTPIVTPGGVTNGMFFWKVEIPMLVTYRSSTKENTVRRIVQLTVVRRQTLESPDGIGISQFIATDI